jgi:Fanconi anemia group M protein
MQHRKYQEAVLAEALEKNLLCVLPTGLGKTPISVLLTAHRLQKYPKSKILTLAPTKPLTNQNCEAFQKFLSIDSEQFQVITGLIIPKERKKLYETKKLIFATPQTIRNDILNGLISLKDFSLITFDESHHSIGRYAYPFIAKNYLETAKNPRILGLTASPGGTREKIMEICKNLGIEAVEIRTEEDKDVIPYIKEKEITWIEVDLPESFENIRSILTEVYQEKLQKLKKLGYLKPTKYITKKDLLGLQINLQKRIRSGKKTAFWGISVVAQAIKVEHALGLLETQGIAVLENYWKKLQDDKSRAAKMLIKDKKISNTIFMTHNLFEKGSRHPKISKLCSIVEQQLQQKPESKIIIFANFRETVKGISKVLKTIPKAKPVILIGQREGVTQKEQIETIKAYESGTYNCLVSTSIGEEGLSLESADLAIFYESVPSEIRLIQRRGRVGRTKFGKIMVLITRKTRDEAYKWSAYHKEKHMKKILASIKDSKKTLQDFD